ncbi:MAG: hypothetical protein WAW90_03590 [Minisyncoccia bacterium]
MNNKIIGIIAGVIVLGGAWYLVATPSKVGDTSDVATTTSQVASSTTVATQAPVKSGTAQKAPLPPAKVNGVGPFSYLFSLKQSLVCTIKTSPAKRTGTMYIADGMMRANLSGYVNGVLTNTVMISSGEYLYVWTRGSTRGLKLPAAVSVSGSAIASNGGFDPVSNLTYSCNLWTKDASVFAPSSAVSFSNSL